MLSTILVVVVALQAVDWDMGSAGIRNIHGTRYRDNKEGTTYAEHVD